MKKITTCKRAVLYDRVEDKIVAILGDCFNPTLSDYDIMCLVFNPTYMSWVDLPLREEIWIRNSNIRLEIISEYKEVEQWFDKIWRVIHS